MKNQVVGKTIFITGILFVLGFLNSCQKEPLSPQNEAVVNMTDNLSIAYENMNKNTDTKTYTYDNTGVTQSLSVASQLTNGSVNVKITDGSGNIIHDKNYSNISADVVFFSNTSSVWTVELKLKKASGNLGITLVKTQ